MKVVRVQQIFKDSDYFTTKYHYLVDDKAEIGDIVTDNERTVGRIIQFIYEEPTQKLKHLDIIPFDDLKSLCNKLEFNIISKIYRKLKEDFLITIDDKIVSEKQLRVLSCYDRDLLENKTYEQISNLVAKELIYINDYYDFAWDLNDYVPINN